MRISLNTHARLNKSFLLLHRCFPLCNRNFIHHLVYSLSSYFYAFNTGTNKDAQLFTYNLTSTFVAVGRNRKTTERRDDTKQKRQSERIGRRENGERARGGEGYRRLDRARACPMWVSLINRVYRVLFLALYYHPLLLFCHLPRFL